MSGVVAINVIGAGLVPVDIVQTVGEYWKADDSPPAYVSGGTVGNILCHLSRQGWPCSIVGRVGPDSLGEVLRKDLETFGVDTETLLLDGNAVTRRICHLIAVSGPQKGSHRFDLQCFRCKQHFPNIQPPTFDAIHNPISAKIDRKSVV